MKTEKREWCRRHARGILIFVPALAAFLVYLAVGGLLLAGGGYTQAVATAVRSAAGITCVLAYLLLALWEVTNL